MEESEKRKAEDQGRERWKKGDQSRETRFLGGSKNRPAKAAGAEPSGEMRDNKWHAIVAQSASKSKCGKRTNAAVAYSTFRCQNDQNTAFSEQFWKLRCRKSARRCDAKHVLKAPC